MKNKKIKKISPIKAETKSSNINYRIEPSVKLKFENKLKARKISKSYFFDTVISMLLKDEI